MLVFKTIQKGFKHFGANALFEVLRWQTGVSGNDKFKINSNYIAYYARAFESKYPEHKGFFRLRKSKFDVKTGRETLENI